MRKVKSQQKIGENQEENQRLGKGKKEDKAIIQEDGIESIEFENIPDMTKSDVVKLH